MAGSFLQQVAQYIYEHYKDNVEKLCIVLPNKRGALFLKQHLAQEFGKTIWLPTIISAQDLISEISELKTIEEIDLICYLYDSYATCYGSKAEPFDSFTKWGQLILQDFNEIDRYLADSEQLYENLKDIKVIENWSLNDEKLTEFQINYLEFMNSLGTIYKHFTHFLLQHKYAYQGLAYKEAVKNISTTPYTAQFDKLLFCGFNALNAAELQIFNYLFLQKKADILWDADNYYLKNTMHEAGHFLRNNLELFKQKEPLFVENHFGNAKNIEIISVPKQIGQSQVVKQCVQKYIDQQIPLDKVAIVLANEKLLWPVLQQLPEAVEHVNITMEYPLRYTSTYALIDTVLQIQLNFKRQNRQLKTVYYKDFITLLQQPLFNSFLEANEITIDINKILNDLNQRNISFVSRRHLEFFFGKDLSIILSFLSEPTDVLALCNHLTLCLKTLHEHFTNKKGNNKIFLELEYLNILINNLNRLNEVLLKYPHFNNLNSFKQLFNQVVGNSTASFIGEPLRGLQIMGVLETRTLDFEYLIIINVNEGVLPSGKTINSFIPNDLKRAFGLPLYLEKDAIYSYHFYRLLQRANEVTITYDSETDTFGKGEKSRFITQLQLELSAYNPQIKITEKVAGTIDVPPPLKNTIEIEKTSSSLERILKKAKDAGKFGSLSPSSLIMHKECGLKFYFRYGAGLKEIKKVEENAESNTFGSILHLSLQYLYSGFTNKILSVEQLKAQLKIIPQVVKKSFSVFFDSDELTGKNILQEEVIKVYVEKLIRNDIKWIESLANENRYLTLNALEKEFSASLEVHIGGATETIFIRGTIDRIDTYDNKVRIIDYKNSLQQSDKFSFTGFEDLFENRNTNKQFQIIMYAWLLYKNNFCMPEQMQPGIIPFKEFLNEPKFLTLAKEQMQFNKPFLEEFEQHLIAFIQSIYNPLTPFSQTPDTDICKYCAYNVVCNR
ncbi:MAG: PD-(D/E)XK nuclease family protein [Bacteroidetes bacterium]|nr:PD-(D/E)XK nuclease family protein [Bacteroidota bacterium]